jgi:type I restriction enzyme R subunit
MELLARLVNLTDADPFDLLLHVAFGEQALTRRERANRVRRERADFFAQYVTAAREILEIILQKYEAGEAPDVSDTDLLRVPPLSERGTFMELAQHFSGGASMRAALRELHTLLYSA